jgi:hypothetical protein
VARLEVSVHAIAVFPTHGQGSARDCDLFSSPEKRWLANPNDAHQPTTEAKYQFQLKNLALLLRKLCVPHRLAFSGASFDSREDLRVPSFALGAPEDKILSNAGKPLAVLKSRFFRHLV